MLTIRINDTLWVSPTMISSAYLDDQASFMASDPPETVAVAVTVLGDSQPAWLTRGGVSRWTHADARAVLEAFRTEIADAQLPFLLRFALTVWRRFSRSAALRTRGRSPKR